MKTLLLIEIQNDFLPGGALPVPGGDEIVSVVNRVLPQFELVVATVDWHPAEHCSFAANHPGRKIGDVLDLHGVPQRLWPVHCVQNTGGACFAPGLMTQFIARIFQKGTHPEVDSYSGFFDNRRQRSSELGDYLGRCGATELWVGGLATDYCVQFTVLDALAEGFSVVVIEDACRGIEAVPGDVDRAFGAMKGAGASVRRSDVL